MTKTEAPWRPEEGKKGFVEVEFENFNGVAFCFVDFFFRLRTKLPRDLEADARRASRDEHGLVFGEEFRERGRTRVRERASKVREQVEKKGISFSLSPSLLSSLFRVGGPGEREIPAAGRRGPSRRVYGEKKRASERE